LQHRFKSAKPRLQGLAFESPALPASRSCRRTPQHSSNSFHYRSRNPAFLTFCPRPPACIPAKETSSHGAMTLRTSNYFHRVQHYQQEHDAKHAHSKRRCLRVESTHASVLAAAHPMLTHFRSRTANGTDHGIEAALRCLVPSQPLPFARAPPFPIRLVVKHVLLG